MGRNHSGSAAMLKQIRMDTYAYSSIKRFDESGNQVKQGTETRTGRTLPMTSVGNAIEYTTTVYYYATYSGQVTAYVQINLILNTGSTLSFKVKVI